jgi:hypothetical protein
MQTPAVWLRESAASPAGLGRAQTYDVPAFLRKGPDGDREYSVSTSMFSSYSSQVAELLDKSNRRFWIGQAGAKELTPLGLSAWLGLMLKGDWPTNYPQLLAIGVSNEVLEWLSLIIADGCNEEDADSDADADEFG